MNVKSAPPASKVDGSAVLRFLLGYEDFWRLMILLLTAGVLAGTCYYVFARATFSSTATIRVNQFFDSANVAQGGVRDLNYLRLRSLMDQLSSGYMILSTARELGVAGGTTTYNQVRANVIPAVRVSLLDQSHLELSVSAFDAKVVLNFPEALIRVYAEDRARLKADFRDKAIDRYIAELAEVRKKVSVQLGERLRFEEESSLASAQIELEKLSGVPVELIRNRYRLEEMDRILSVLESRGEDLGTIGKLSLLTSLPDRGGDSLRSGRIVRTTGDPRSSPVSFESPETKKEFTQVVIQPDMVEGLDPWKELEKKKRSLEEEIRMTRLKFLDDHPEMLKLEEELRSVTAGLESELEVAERAFMLERDQLTEGIAKLEGKLPAYHEATKSFDQKRLDYDLLQKGQLAWDKAYEQLSKQIEGLQFGAEDGALSLEFRGFTLLRDEIPVSPSKSKLLMMGLLMGLGLAGGVPFLLRKMDSSVSDLAEFEKTLGIPGIGLIPLAEPGVLEDICRSPALGATTPNALLENFRLIRSSVLLNRSPRGEAKVVMLTSARPGEGKTTVAANVAWAFASMGDRTLLIDCDLRRGRVHGVIGKANDTGLTDFLTGKATIDDCLVQTGMGNLSAIPRGPVVPGTTELLNTAVFSKALAGLKERFDRIVLDTPPVLGLSETAFLQHHAEGVVLVVRSSRTKRQDVEDAFNALSKLGAHFYGFVLNGVDFSKKANHYQYYYYSASYYEDEWEVPQQRSSEPSGSKVVPAS